MTLLRRTLSRPWYLAILLVAAVTILGCGKEEKEKPAPVVKPVKTLTVGGAIRGVLSFPARVDAGKKAALSFRIPGRLIELPVKEGQEVKKGQLIARLDPRDYQIAREAAKAEYDKAEADFKRYQTLYEKDAVPLAEFDARRSQRDMAKAKLEEAQTNLRYTYLRAPFSGRIGKRYVENHMDVQAQQKIVDLNDLSTMEVSIDLPENIVKKVKEDHLNVKIFATFDTVRDKLFPLTLKEASNRADPTTQTFKVTFTMPQPEDIELLPGMSGEVKIFVQREESAKGEEASTFSVPAFAVMGDEKGGSYVWVLDPKEMTVHKREVKVGPIIGQDGIVILDGLEPGETIVTAGVTKLEEGMKVRAWKEQEKGK